MGYMIVSYLCCTVSNLIQGRDTVAVEAEAGQKGKHHSLQAMSETCRNFNVHGKGFGGIQVCLLFFKPLIFYNHLPWLMLALMSCVWHLMEARIALSFWLCSVCCCKGMHNAALNAMLCIIKYVKFNWSF